MHTRGSPSGSDILSTNQSDYKKNCKETRISKPSILSGLIEGLMFPIPGCFLLDLMHLLFINLDELLIPLWQGTLQCDSMDNISNWAWATSAKINISYSILFNLTTSYSSYFGGKKGISRNKTSFFLLMNPDWQCLANSWQAGC